MKKWIVQYSSEEDTMHVATVEATTYTQAYMEFVRRYPSTYEITEINEIKEN